MFEKILIIGTGMIGGSVALAIRENIRENKLFQNTKIYGWDNSQVHRKSAKKLGIVDIIPKSLAYGIAQADLIILSVPLTAYSEIFAEINKNINPQKMPIITDVGSVKGYVEKLAKNKLTYSNKFIPAHPIAGRETSGPQSASASLFHDHYLIITPTDTNKKSDVGKIKKLWQALGAKVEIMSVTTHDEICAGISHLPHLLSMALVHYLLNKPNANKYLQFAAGGFRDFTRIAASDAKMWHDVFLANKDILLQNLSELELALKDFRSMIKNSKNTSTQQKLFNTLEKVSLKRRNWQQNGRPIKKSKS